MTILGSEFIGATLNGGGPLISLGIEQVITNNPALVTYYYNCWAIITTAIIAFSSGQLDSRFMAILTPVWAGFTMFAGWLVYPNMGTGFGIIVVCVMLAIVNYMTETRHERFGIAGPGNIIIKIFTFIVILQCAVVFVNNAAIFPSDTQPITTSNTQYISIDFVNQTYSIASSGGLLAQAVDIASATLQIAISSLLLFLKCILAITVFSLVLTQIFPWIGQAGAVGAAFLVLMQFAIWTVYVCFIVILFYKPGPDPQW